MLEGMSLQLFEMHALLATVLVFANKHLSGTMAFPSWRHTYFLLVLLLDLACITITITYIATRILLPPQTYQASLLSAQMLQSETHQCYSGSTNSNAPKPAIAVSKLHLDRGRAHGL